MSKRIAFFSFATLLWISLALSPNIFAQQTLGGITGTVTDESGAVIPGATVTAVGDQTKLTRTIQSSDTGAYLFTNLPIGTYTITVTHTGFDTLNIPMIQVQADRTATVNATLKIGEVGQTVTVEETPLVNAVDTTNGYVLEKQQLESIPLPTGSFTGVAILSPGVNAELSPGTGANSGLGNQPIWANGQRDTSNSFLLNGVDASNLFNGKSTSSVPSARIVNNTGNGGASSTTAEIVQSSASPYLAIGQALPTPAPETLTEVRVNTSMYDAQQGSSSGAHIDMSTASGTNQIHGSAYVHRGTDWLNAAPYFFKDDTNIPDNEKVPELHRYVAGGPFGVNQSPPWVNSQVCSSIGSFYEGFIPTCDPTSPTGGSFANPWGAQLGPAPSGNPANIASLLPNRAAIIDGAPLFSFGVYNRANKLPYTLNQTLDIQWQPRSAQALPL